MSDYTLKTTLDNIFKDLKVNKKFHEKLITYMNFWLTKNKVNMDFISGNLIGVSKPIFGSEDVNYLFENVLEIHQVEIKKIVHNLDIVDTDRVVQSDIFNIVMFYLMHRCLLANKIDIGVVIYQVYSFKTFARLQRRYFPKYEVDESIAKMVYESMSKRYIIKAEGSVNGMMIYRAKELLKNNKKLQKRLRKFESVSALNLISDAYTKYSSTMKETFRLTETIQDSANRINDETLVGTDSEGVSNVKNITQSVDGDIQKVIMVMQDAHRFIRDDYIMVIVHETKTSKKNLKKLLDWVVNSQSTSDKIMVDNLVRDALLVTVNYLQDSGVSRLEISEVFNLIGMVKNLWQASRPNDKLHGEVKSKGQELVKKAIKKRDKSLVNLLIVSFYLYVFLFMMLDKRTQGNG